MAISDSEGSAAFDVAGITAAAMALGTEPAPVAPVVPAPVASPLTAAAPVASPVVGEQPPAVDPAAPVAEPQVMDIPDTALVRVKVDGVDVIMPYGEARGGFMRGAKFTKSQQEVRALEGTLNEKLTGLQQLEARAAAAERYEQLLTNDRALVAYVQKVMPHLTVAQATAVAAGAVPAALAAPAPTFDPEGLATLGQTQQVVQARVAEIESQVGRRLNEMEVAHVARSEQLLAGVSAEVDKRLAVIANAQEVAAIDSRIEKSIGDLQTANPQLSAIPNLNDLIRFEVRKLHPKSETEMFEAVELVGKAIVEQLDAHYTLTRQAAVIEKQKLVTEGTEAPNGAPALTFQRPLTHRDANGQFSWDSLAKVAQARANM